MYTGQNMVLQGIKKQIKDTQRSGWGTTLPFLTALLLRSVEVAFSLDTRECSPRPPAKEKKSRDISPGELARRTLTWEGQQLSVMPFGGLLATEAGYFPLTGSRD